MDKINEEIYANALNLVPNLGPVRLGHLFNNFQSYEKAWGATRADFVNIGINPKLTEQIILAKNKIDPHAEYAKLKKFQIEIILAGTQDYPQILKEISAFPPILYVRGNKKILNTTCIAVVGTRKITPYGKSACSEIVSGLSRSHLTIVSGLAYGVDATALKTASDESAPAVAVVATPIDDASISPKTNFQLAQRIIKNGCLISEYPLGAQVQKGNFPVRNRIIAGLSIGTLVVEADLDSGSLITAAYALEQNRDVFAVPGSIYSEVSRGTNELIKKGAKLVNTYQDVLEELNLDQVVTPIEQDITTDENELKVIELLSREPTHIDELTRQLDLSTAEVSATLVLLEMKGRVRNLGGAKFSKIR